MSGAAGPGVAASGAAAYLAIVANAIRSGFPLQEPK
jgi:hypothetical protein